jgi:Flp pilus assembly protein TadG
VIRSTLRRDARGQALVEFSLALIVFVVLLMGILDFGMAIYEYNGVSQAAREVARVASVHQGTNFSSAQINAVVATQQGLIPGLSSPTYACQTITGGAVALVNNACPTTAFVNVTVTAPYKAATPLLGLLGTWTMKGSSTAQVQQ